MTGQQLRDIFPLFRQSISNSYTQVFFSKDKLLGVLLIVVSFFEPVAGLSGLTAVVCSNAVAYAAGLNRQKVSEGLYGFNALLTGLGLGLTYQLNTAFVIVLIFAALLSLFFTVMLEGMLQKYTLPYLSLPFLLALWVTMLSTREFTHLHMSERGIYALNEMYLLGGMPLVKVYLWFEAWPLHEGVKLYFRSLGAIFFQYHLFAGMVVAAGLLLWSRQAFLFSVAGFAAAWVFYQITGLDINAVNDSYIGFNFILTAIAIGVFFVVPSWITLLWVFITVPLLAFLISAGGSMLGVYQLSVYSLPFNLVVILLLYFFKVRERYHEHPTLVFIQQGSPERNLYSFLVNRHRLWHLGKIPVRLPFYGKWLVTQGIDGAHTHKDVWKYAWDFEMRDEEGKTYKGEGHVAEDYYCYGKPVVAVADGYVSAVADGIDDNRIGDANTHENWGNSVVIYHAEAFFSQMSHLRKGSILVKTGQFVRKGEQIASCGNSGRSPYPHLHFQFQTAGDIGSATLNYPFAAFLKHGERQTFHASAQPLLNEEVSNHQIEPLLDQALHFIPGQELRFSHTGGKAEETVSWKTETDIYNNSYLLCEKTGAKAWFIRHPDIFYFTHFEGDKKSRLFDFYLAAYQIVTGYTPGLEVSENITTVLFPNKLLLFLQDFAAPFFRFLNITYRLQPVKRSSDLNSTRIQMKSEVQFKVGRRLQKSRKYGLLFENNQLTEFSIHAGDTTQTFSRV